MLAAFLWPTQELLNKYLLPPTTHFSVVNGGQTNALIPLVMFAICGLLGYLDIHSSEIKRTETGEAFLPGDCFWDPLKMMSGQSPPEVNLLMEKELMNGRSAMLAVSVYALEELCHGVGIVELPFNQVLFHPFFLLSWEEFLYSMKMY